MDKPTYVRRKQDFPDECAMRRKVDQTEINETFFFCVDVFRSLICLKKISLFFLMGGCKSRDLSRNTEFLKSSYCMRPTASSLLTTSICDGSTHVSIQGDDQQYDFQGHPRSRSRTSQICENGRFRSLYPPPELSEKMHSRPILKSYSKKTEAKVKSPAVRNLDNVPYHNHQ